MWSVLFLALFQGERSGAAPDPATNLIIDKAKIDMQDSSSGPEKSQTKDQKNRIIAASHGRGGGNDYQGTLGPASALVGTSSARMEIKVCKPGSKWTEDGGWECECKPDGQKAHCITQSGFDYEGPSPSRGSGLVRLNGKNCKEQNVGTCEPDKSFPKMGSCKPGSKWEEDVQTSIYTPSYTIYKCECDPDGKKAICYICPAMDCSKAGSGGDYERESGQLRGIKSPKAGGGGGGGEAGGAYAKDYNADYQQGCTCFWYPRCPWCRVTRFGQYGWGNGVGLPPPQMG